MNALLQAAREKPGEMRKRIACEYVPHTGRLHYAGIG